MGGKVKDKGKDAVLVRFPHPRQPSDTKPHPGHADRAVGKLGRRQVAVCAPGMWCVLSRLTGMGEPLGEC